MTDFLLEKLKNPMRRIRLNSVFDPCTRATNKDVMRADAERDPRRT